MEDVLQILAVVVLVTASIVFATWRLTPARLKLRWLDRLKPDTGRIWGRSVARLRRKVAAELMHGCGACAAPAKALNRRAAQRELRSKPPGD